MNCVHWIDCTGDCVLTTMPLFLVLHCCLARHTATTQQSSWTKHENNLFISYFCVCLTTTTNDNNDNNNGSKVRIWMNFASYMKKKIKRNAWMNQWMHNNHWTKCLLCPGHTFFYATRELPSNAQTNAQSERERGFNAIHKTALATNMQNASICDSWMWSIRPVQFLLCSPTFYWTANDALA